MHRPAPGPGPRAELPPAPALPPSPRGGYQREQDRETGEDGDDAPLDSPHKGGHRSEQRPCIYRRTLGEDVCRPERPQQQQERGEEDESQHEERLEPRPAAGSPRRHGSRGNLWTSRGVVLWQVRAGLWLRLIVLHLLFRGVLLVKLLNSDTVNRAFAN